MQALIAGMHRSGTSIVTRLMNLAGFHVGAPDEMMQAMPDNPGGYWERNDVCRLNTSALQAAGVDWNTTLGDEWTTIGPARRKEVVHSFRQVVQELEEHRPWAVKDPRFSVLLPLWKPLLSDPVVVICHRHPVEVARSLHGRDGMPLSIGVALWEVYTLAVLEYTRALPRVIVTHDEVLSSPVECTQRLVAQLHRFGASSISVPDRDQIEGLIDAKLYRSKHVVDRDLEILRPSQQRLLAAVTAGDELDDFDLAALSPTSRELIVFYREAVAGRSERRRAERSLFDRLVERTETKLEAAGIEMQRLHEAKADVGARLEMAAAERNELREALNASQADRRRLEDELQAARTEAAELAGRLTEAHHSLEDIGRRLDEAGTERDRLATEIRQAHADRAAMGVQLDRIRAEAQELRQQAAAATGEQQRLTDELRASRAEANELAGRLAEVHQTLAGIGKQVEELGTDNGRLATELARLHEERGELGSRLEQAHAELTRVGQLLEAARENNRRMESELEAARALERELDRLRTWRAAIEARTSFKVYRGIFGEPEVSAGVPGADD